MPDHKPDSPAFPGAAPAVAQGTIDRYGSWSGQAPAAVEQRRTRLVKEEEPVASRHGTLTRSLNNYVNFRVWSERARAQWDAPAPEPSATAPGTPRRR